MVEVLQQRPQNQTDKQRQCDKDGQEKQILMCVVSRKEAVFMVKYIKEVDNRAFVIVADAREVLGEGFGMSE